MNRRTFLAAALGAVLAPARLIKAAAAASPPVPFDAADAAWTPATGGRVVGTAMATVGPGEHVLVTVCDVEGLGKALARASANMRGARGLV